MAGRMSSGQARETRAGIRLARTSERPAGEGAAAQIGRSDLACLFDAGTGRKK